MYRAVSYYFLDNDIDFLCLSEDQMAEVLEDVKIEFRNINGQNTIFLNGENINEEIRSGRVSKIVSEVAAISTVRKKLVYIQQSYASQGSLVMDGRDIGSIVFPNADIKFFVTADMKIRAKRRYLELVNTKNELNEEEVLENLKHRDHIDSTRSDSPLTQTQDAIVIDTSYHTRESQLDFALQHVKSIMQGND